MSSTCFELKGSSSGRRLNIQLWYSTFCMHHYKQTALLMHVKRIIPKLYIPIDEPSGSKHVEDIKKLEVKILIWKMCILLVCIL